jgi:hypothetical protein
MVTGSDAVAGLDFKAQVGDGFPDVPGSKTDGPNITFVDIVGDAVFSNNNTGQQDPGSVPQVALRTTTTATGTINANGRLATLIIDTTGFSTGVFELKLSNTFAGATEFLDAQGNVLPAQILDGTISLGRATPSILWQNPPDILFGTVLTERQLNAQASIPGTFMYSPDLGAILNARLGQELSVTFTPSDTAAFTTATGKVTLNVLKANQSITFEQITNRAADAESLKLMAQSNSGLPVSFGILSGPATVSNDVLTLTGAGEVIVRASQEGSDNFNPAQAIDQQFMAYIVISDVKISPVGAFSFTFKKIPGRIYVIETSSDLADWREIKPSLDSSESGMFSEIQVPLLTGQYFRVVQKP